MNGDWSAGWSSYDLPSLSQVPTSVVVGIIRVSSDRETFAGGDETLHGTLCRLAGVIPEELENLIPRRSRPLEAHEFAGQLELSADVPQISADLAEEYHELVAAIGS